jgi:hypothetical protein
MIMDISQKMLNLADKLLLIYVFLLRDISSWKREFIRWNDFHDLLSTNKY